MGKIYKKDEFSAKDERVFLAWIRKQESWLTGRTPCEAAHVRRAGKAGTAYKPRLWSVPMTHDEHSLQTLHGEIACLERYGNLFIRQTLKALNELEKLWVAKSAFDRGAQYYRNEFLKQRGNDE